MLNNSILVAMDKKNLRLSKIVWLTVVSILVLIPFHAFLSVWVGSSLNVFDAIRLWKEVLILILLSGCAVLIFRDKGLRTELSQNWIFRIGIIFCIWITGMSLWGYLQGSVGIEAAAYGLTIDARPILFLLVAFIAARSYSRNDDLPLYIILPASVVIIFGLFQLFIPADFLRHFGYGIQTLPAFQTVDNKAELVRLQSTLRGPNPLGAYLVVVGLITLSYRRMKRSLWYLFLGSLIVVLYSTYSRSAWLGALLGLFVYFTLIIKNPRVRAYLYAACGIFIIVASLTVYTFRNNDFIQNVFFHTNERSKAALSSNTVRFESLRSGLAVAAREPFGKGVGAAGPASTHNTKNVAHINENFFLQIAEEAGWMGLLLFSAFLVMVIRSLFILRSDPFACALIASFVATSAINMVSHAWADDTLAYVLFGITGIYLASKNSTKSEKKV